MQPGELKRVNSLLKCLRAESRGAPRCWQQVKPSKPWFDLLWGYSSLGKLENWWSTNPHVQGHHKPIWPMSSHGALHFALPPPRPMWQADCLRPALHVRACFCCWISMGCKAVEQTELIGRSHRPCLQTQPQMGLLEAIGSDIIMPLTTVPSFMHSPII